MANNTEAPASATITVKTPGGFETLVTVRDYEDKELTKKQLAYLINLDKTLHELGFTPVIRGYGNKQAKPVEYVDGLKCPVDGARLVKATTKDGRKLIKCENNKWNAATRQAEGCKYTKWDNDPPVRDVREDY